MISMICFADEVAETLLVKVSLSLAAEDTVSSKQYFRSESFDRFFWRLITCLLQV